MARLPRQQQDARRRRQPPADPGRRRLLWGVAVVAVVVVAWLTWPSGEPTERAGAVEAFGLADDPYLGNASAPVVLVGYESPHCSSCQHFHRNLLPGLREEFFDPGNVTYHYIQGTIGDDRASSIAQECAHRHGGNDAFWNLTDRFYARGYTYTTPPLEEWLRDLAAGHELDEEELLGCYRGRETETAVLADLRVGREHGAAGTPTFWLVGAGGDVARVSDWGSLEQVLRDAVREASEDAA